MQFQSYLKFELHRNFRIICSLYQPGYDHFSTWWLHKCSSKSPPYVEYESLIPRSQKSDYFPCTDPNSCRQHSFILFSWTSFSSYHQLNQLN